MSVSTEAPPEGLSSKEEVELEDPRREAIWTRLVLPLALPVVSALAAILWILNISRAFLAGSKTTALIIVVIVTVAIMVGAAVMSATPRMLTSSKLLFVAFAFVLVVAAGFISLGPSEGGEEAGGGGFVPPTGPAVATLEVDALPTLKFQADINYVSEGGTHNLVFAEPEFAGFELQVPPTDKGKIDLKAGSYTIFCSIPGHRAAGMEATLTIK
jgi:hypothetical protein